MSLNRDDSPEGQPAKLAKGRIATRRVARSLGMQALYQWHLAGQGLHEIEAQFRVDNDFRGVDGNYFHELLNGVIRDRGEIDALLLPHLSIPFDELDPVELAIMRLSTYELLKRHDVPYRVVINEGVELAKVFGATDGHKFVNGVLDKLAPELRSAEVRAHKG